jgi:hypothetical protein
VKNNAAAAEGDVDLAKFFLCGLQLAEPKILGSWNELCDVYSDHSEEWDEAGWLFRGQSVPPDSRQPKNQLSTSLLG